MSINAESFVAASVALDLNVCSVAGKRDFDLVDIVARKQEAGVAPVDFGTAPDEFERPVEVMYRE